MLAQDLIDIGDDTESKWSQAVWELFNSLDHVDRNEVLFQVAMLKLDASSKSEDGDY